MKHLLKMSDLNKEQITEILDLADKLKASTGLKVNVAERPSESVVLGLSKILKDENYKSVAYAIEGMGK